MKRNDELIYLLTDEAVNKYKNKEIVNGEDVEDFLGSLLEPLLQKLLEAELDNHLEYSKYEHAKDKKDNARNGFCKSKKVETKYGTVKVSTPRDRKGTFEPEIIPKGQNKLPCFEEKCISLYAKGLSLRDIESILRDLYKVKITKDQITTLISKVNEQVDKWKNRKLKPLYTFTFADCIWVPFKDGLTTKKKAVYVIVGIDANGFKDILGIWIDKTESASFWANVFEDLKARGVEDILYMTSDGIAGFQGSLETAFQKTQNQRCVVHLCRNIAKLCNKKEVKSVVNGFKKIYKSSTCEEAYGNLELFKEEFKDKRTIVKKVEDFMQYLEPLFELPAEIRKVIYTSNAIESVNSALRKVTNGKGAFVNEETLCKLLFLRINDLKDKWNKPIYNWKIISKQLIALHGERFTKYIEI